ncbi:HAD family phosphatase [Polynucleobacter sp. 86C-FISCH]|uniref:HAD family hydrolase n=1 Tax=Polynucleobacter sp. 86C-FISCH TaxID=2689101 RepID=UPI001C0D8FEB|nr:HAD family phosphatase [Polynucleobacter sp. 86C-FISCH]MBU3596000.1 HAD family phosphatase [Polynucleobacter sp. 86C-FISCH]
MSKIKAVLFDMDGVLIDAKDWHYEALNQALSLFGMAISRYDHLVTYDGLPTKKKLEMLTLERGLPRALHQFINDIKQEFTFQLGYAKCKPTFNHQYALSNLKARGYRLAACSNSIRKTMDVLFERAAITQYFDFYISNEDVRDSKPHPEMYLTAIKRLGLKPSECLILEDNDNGIRAAKASGAHLLVINDVDDVNLECITNRIKEIEVNQ